VWGSPITSGLTSTLWDSSVFLCKLVIFLSHDNLIFCQISHRRVTEQLSALERVSLYYALSIILHFSVSDNKVVTYTFAGFCRHTFACDWSTALSQLQLMRTRWKTWQGWWCAIHDTNEILHSAHVTMFSVLMLLAGWKENSSACKNSAPTIGKIRNWGTQWMKCSSSSSSSSSRWPVHYKVVAVEMKRSSWQPVHAFGRYTADNNLSNICHWFTFTVNETVRKKF